MIRESVFGEVSRILLGPISGVEEELEINPLDFYSVGILFPQLSKSDDFVDADPEEIISEENVDSASNETKIQFDFDKSAKRRAALENDDSESPGEFELTTKFRPSAAGLSILTGAHPNMTLEISYATYKRTKIEKQIIVEGENRSQEKFFFKRAPKNYLLECKNGEFEIGNIPSTKRGKMISINLDDNIQLIITTRQYSKNYEKEIRTFTLVNPKHVTSFKNQKNALDCIFQPCISLLQKDGFHYFEDLSDLTLLNDEDINLKLLYRNYKKYAFGHGISVNWEMENGKVQRVFSQVLPEEKVNGVDLNPEIFKGKDVLYVKRLSGTSVNRDYNWLHIKEELLDFVNLYEAWIAEQNRYIDINPDTLPLEFVKKAKENLKHCENLYVRMKKGIEIIHKDIDAKKSFEEANLAMFMQRVFSDFSRHRRRNGRVQSDNAIFDDKLPDFSSIPFDSSSGLIWSDGNLDLSSGLARNGSLARWRPFQLAFLLSQIEGIVNPESIDRETIDLIWFPTGGGKTEAYLCLTAFTIFYRRLKAKKITGSPDKGAGVTVLMRYTLRLLNKQQFERASIIICACELIRRKDPENYGNARISNGIWMGRTMTPNQETDQIKDYGNYISRVEKAQQPDSYRNSPPLLSCPCCGNRLIKETVNGKVIGRWGYLRERNIKNAETGRYLITCTNTKCEYYIKPSELKQSKNKTIPIFEIDETIYVERPTLLFSTVDKFVQLAWKTESFNLFNIEFLEDRVNRLYPSPELIIQDELHLISSALGTIYGVYEIIIDRLSKEAGGKSPKIIGATATVRNAAEQCKKLYGKSHFMQFPPPGTDADDSFYAKKMLKDDKNRLYVGFMSSGVTTSTALIRLTSVLLERISSLNINNESLDSYYTVVAYFNALKELGKFRTFLTDDIVAYRKLLANHFNTFVKPFDSNTLCELSSVMTADDISSGLDRLEKVTLPLVANSSNPLITKLFQSGIRTVNDLKSARGSVWKNTFINKSFFEDMRLDYTGDFNTDINYFVKHVEELFVEKTFPIQIAPATNMISVGVDIPRLNTMIVVGQPKTSAEYIQASSRVGREKPGIVFTFLSPTKNRDRSHYENFKSFHQAYYYHVESSSVTPFSTPALEKVLPTVLIALTKSLFLKGNGGAFSQNDSAFIDFIDKIVEEIKLRAENIYGTSNAKAINSSIDSIKSEFMKLMQAMAGAKKFAKYSDFMEYNSSTGRIESTIINHFSVYNAPAQFTESILKDHIPTLQTLRNVESSTSILIKS